MSAPKQKSRLMYMHTIDGQPATFSDVHGNPYLWLASNGHRTRAAHLVPSLDRIRREQQACIAEAWRSWNAKSPAFRGERPNYKRYGYILVEVPESASSRTGGQRT